MREDAGQYWIDGPAACFRKPFAAIRSAQAESGSGFPTVAVRDRLQAALELAVAEELPGPDVDLTQDSRLQLAHLHGGKGATSRNRLVGQSRSEEHRSKTKQSLD